MPLTARLERIDEDWPTPCDCASGARRGDLRSQDEDELAAGSAGLAEFGRILDLQAHFNPRPLTALQLHTSADKAPRIAPGWDGHSVDGWRLESRILYWHALVTVAGRAVLTHEDTTYADWIGAYLDLPAALRTAPEDFTQFWLDEVSVQSVPRQWVR